MLRCEICGKEIEFLGTKKIPLDVNGEEFRVGSYQARPTLPQNQKFREEEVYGCRNGCTRMNKKEFLEASNASSLG